MIGLCALCFGICYGMGDLLGVLEQICEGKGYIDMSTIVVDTSSKINEGGQLLEAPISGSKKPVEDGQLVILAAGEK
ncbi:hypothetical protein GIB67_027282, partial [Kingdonia uniflora]